MHQLDTLIERFAAGGISRRGLVKGAAALGVSGAALQALQRSNIVRRAAGRELDPSGCRRAARSTSSTTMPTGSPSRWATSATSRRRLEPGSDRGHRRHQGGRRRAGGRRLSVAGCLLPDDRAGQSRSSPSSRWAPTTSSTSPSRKGQAPAERQGSRREDRSPSGSAGWQGICQSGDRPGRRRPDQGRTTSTPVRSWGQALAQGQADAALSWAGLRAQWAADRSRLRLHPGQGPVEVPGQLLRDSPLRLRGRGPRRYLRPLPPRLGDGLEFGYHNPRAATQITIEATLAALNEIFEDKQIAVESMWQLAESSAATGTSARAGAGTTKRPGTSSSRPRFEIGQLTKELTAAEVLRTTGSPPPTTSTTSRSSEAATAFELTEDFASLTQPEGAGAVRA